MDYYEEAIERWHVNSLKKKSPTPKRLAKRRKGQGGGKLLEKCSCTVAHNTGFWVGMSIFNIIRQHLHAHMAKLAVVVII